LFAGECDGQLFKPSPIYAAASATSRASGFAIAVSTCNELAAGRFKRRSDGLRSDRRAKTENPAQARHENGNVPCLR
jgi:hypothetical protein